MKVLFIASTAKKRNRLDGESIKNRLLEEFLKNQDSINLISVDTDNFRKHIFKLTFLILTNLFRCDKIIVSSADIGSNIVLDFFRKIKLKKDVYYFVIGGSLYRNIKLKNWNINTYKRLKKIYVEASTLKENLNALNIKNVEVINNFRKVEKFKNNWEKHKNIRFIFYGRIIKEKGIEEAIKLIKKLNCENIDCSLDIYGQVKDEYLYEIMKMFDKKIKYKGEIIPNNKKEYEILSRYDIFILPTEYPGECLPGALIDSYIAGLAVVASNWAYANEYIQNNKNGVIFEYKNYDDMYVKTKKMIMNNNIEKYKEESLKLAQNYMIDNVLKKFIVEIKE